MENSAADVFQRVGGRAPCRRTGGDVMELEPLIESGALAYAFHGTAIVAEIFFCGNVGGVDQ